ncbi:MAG: peptidoglycan-binding protein [Bacteroidota bacterium]
MTQFLRQLIHRNQVEVALCRRSLDVKAVQDLQQLLLYLGYGQIMISPVFRADGLYGDQTAQAVRHFAFDHGMIGLTGEVVTHHFLKTLLACYDAHQASLKRNPPFYRPTGS